MFQGQIDLDAAVAVETAKEFMARKHNQMARG